MFQLEELDVELQGDVIVPMRELNRMRREAVELLEGERPKPPVYVKRDGRRVRRRAAAAWRYAARRYRIRSGAAQLTALCRSLEQVEARCETDVGIDLRRLRIHQAVPGSGGSGAAAGQARSRWQRRAFICRARTATITTS